MLEVRSMCGNDAALLASLGVPALPGALVLAKDGEAIGAVYAAAGVLRAVGVVPAWRGKGYGTYLLRAYVKVADVRAARIPQGDKSAARLLQKCGFFRPEGPGGVWARGQRAAGEETALTLAHAFLREHVKPGAFAVDATAGNGHDAVFLCGLVGRRGRVLAFDIQSAAVRATNGRLASHGFAQGWAVLDSHANLAKYAQPGTLDAAVFNLGYLPGGSHSVYTTPDVSVPAIGTALSLLKPGGVLTACLYAGGAQGTRERDAALRFLTGLPQAEYAVRAECFEERPNHPPAAVCVQKRAGAKRLETADFTHLSQLY